MAGQRNAAPVIVKRKKVVEGGRHHGGAWKVAYADFVTAMMAFFLLMWMLNATTENQRKGLADYFSPTIPVNRISGGGDGAFGGDNVFSDETLARSGTGASSIGPRDKAQVDGDSVAAAIEADALRTVAEELLGRSGESMADDTALRHVLTRVTDEGLVVELFDLDNAPLFEGESARPSATLRHLARMISDAFLMVDNGIAVEGHVRSYPVVLRDNPVWDLSAQRAGQMRRLLETVGLPARRMQRVTGHADRDPAVNAPQAARNNRLEVILLRSDKG